MAPADIVGALGRSPASLDALGVRLEERDRDALWWAIGEAFELGAGVSSVD